MAINKRKLYTGNKPIGGAPIKSRRVAREITSKYHSIRNEIDAIKKNSSNVGYKVKSGNRIAELEQSLESMGGTNAYQEASIISTKHFKTSRWVLKMIAKYIPKGTAGAMKIPVLEVGAINTQLQAASHLEVRAIDINSQHPKIEEMDFFDISPDGNFDVVVCSMVINCVTDALKRGDMLIRLSAHLRQATGILCLALPNRCIMSKNVGSESFAALLDALGLDLLETSSTPKITFYTLRRRALVPVPKTRVGSAEDPGYAYANACKASFASFCRSPNGLSQLSHFKGPACQPGPAPSAASAPTTSADFLLYLDDSFWI